MSEENEPLVLRESDNADTGCSDTSCCPPQRPIVRETAKIGRNDPCPCGSGRKHKKCCG